MQLYTSIIYIYIFLRLFTLYSTTYVRLRKWNHHNTSSTNTSQSIEYHPHNPWNMFLNSRTFSVVCCELFFLATVNKFSHAPQWVNGTMGHWSALTAQRSWVQTAVQRVGRSLCFPPPLKPYYTVLGQFCCQCPPHGGCTLQTRTGFTTIECDKYSPFLFELLIIRSDRNAI